MHTTSTGSPWSAMPVINVSPMIRLVKHKRLGTNPCWALLKREAVFKNWIMFVLRFYLRFYRPQGVGATAEGEGRYFRWGLWNTGISSRLPSLQLLLSMFSRNRWRKFRQKSFSISPIDWTLTQPPFSLPPPALPTCIPPINIYHLDM